MAIFDFLNRDNRFTISSGSWAESRQAPGLTNEGPMDLSTDPRVQKYLDAVKSEVTKNGWTAEHNEKEIAEASVRIMHSDEHFGGYDKGISREIELEGKLKDLRSAEKPNKREIAITEKQLDSTIDKNMARRPDSFEPQKLENYDKGELICREQAYVASLAMHDNGVENKIIGGWRGDESHAFIQTKSGKVIEPTSPNEPLRHSYGNDGDISKGDVVLASKNQNAVLLPQDVKEHENRLYNKTYGSNEFDQGSHGLSAGKDTEQRREGRSERRMDAMHKEIRAGYKNAVNNSDEIADQSRDKMAASKDGSVKLEDRAEYDMRTMISMDKGTGLFGKGAYDGYLSAGELNKGMEKLGLERGQPLPESITKHMKDGQLDLRAYANGLETDLIKADKNHDGKLSTKEQELGNIAPPPHIEGAKPQKEHSQSSSRPGPR